MSVTKNDVAPGGPRGRVCWRCQCRCWFIIKEGKSNMKLLSASEHAMPAALLAGRCSDSDYAKIMSAFGAHHANTMPSRMHPRYQWLARPLRKKDIIDNRNRTFLYSIPRLIPLISVAVSTMDKVWLFITPTPQCSSTIFDFV